MSNVSYVVGVSPQTPEVLLVVKEILRKHLVSDRVTASMPSSEEVEVRSDRGSFTVRFTNWSPSASQVVASEAVLPAGATAGQDMDALAVKQPSSAWMKWLSGEVINGLARTFNAPIADEGVEEIWSATADKTYQEHIKAVYPGLDPASPQARALRDDEPRPKTKISLR